MNGAAGRWATRRRKDLYIFPIDRQHARLGGFLVALALFLFVLTPVQTAGAAVTYASGFAGTTITGLTQPTSMSFAPDGRAFVAEKTGKLRVVKGGVLLPTPFVQLTVDTLGERGLIGVVVHPNFPQTNRIYVHYTVPGSPPHNRVSWFNASGNVASGPEHVIVELPGLGASNHNGGALHFGEDDQLYISIGENAVQANSQSLTTPLGKVLRVTRDGAPSVGNPFADGAGPNDDRIWARGLRNPFTFAVQPGTGTIHINDVGSSTTGACGTGTWEEINVGSAGANYGWPSVEGPVLPGCPQTGFDAPLYAYSHSDPGSPCAIAGGDFYNPTSTPLLGASLVGSYFFADLCGGWIRYRNPDGTIAQLASGIVQPDDVRTGPDGALWYLNIGNGSPGNGSLGRITATPHPYTLLERNTATTGAADRTLQFGEQGDPMVFCDWDGNGNDTPAAFRDGTWFIRYSNSTGLADLIVRFGEPGDIPVCGKWQTGATKDTIGVYRNGTFYLRTVNAPGVPTITVAFGEPGVDIPVVGDWNGDGVDTIGVRHNLKFQLRNSNTAGPADIVAKYGAGTDTPIVGDWNGDGVDTFGVHRGDTYLLRNTNAAGPTNIVAQYGLVGDTPAKGDFDRFGSTNRGDGIAVIR